MRTTYEYSGPSVLGFIFWIVAAVAFIGIVSLLTGCVGTSTTYDHGIPNLQQVEPGVWRSGQPTTVEQWRYLESLGIRWDLKLNDVREGDDSAANGTSIVVLNSPLPPMGDTDIISQITGTFVEPEQIQVDDALAAIRTHKADGILIHCTHGQDRTGLIVGLRRVLDDGFDPTTAYNEMLTLGFHPELHGLHEYWEKFAKAHAL